MARLMHGDTSELFRAVITTYELRTGYADPSEYTSHAGPFTTHSAAVAAVTRESRVSFIKLHNSRFMAERTGRDPAWEDILVEGKVQRTAIHWETP